VNIEIQGEKLPLHIDGYKAKKLGQEVDFSNNRK
jgi:hypothetical protein